MASARLRASLPADWLVQRDHLADLVADRVERVEAGHRLLEDHGDLPAADLAEILRARRLRGRTTRSSRSRNRMLPPAIAPGLDSSPMIDRLVTDLPEPDSPTTASVSAALQVEGHAVDRLGCDASGHEPGLQILDRQYGLGRDRAGHEIHPQCGQACASVRHSSPEGRGGARRSLRAPRMAWRGSNMRCSRACRALRILHGHVGVDDIEQGELRRLALLQQLVRAARPMARRGVGGRSCHHVLEPHAERQELRHGRRHVPDRAVDRAVVQVGRDGLRRQAARQRRLGHVEGERRAAMADVEHDAARRRLFGQPIKVLVLEDRAAGLAVEAVGDDVAFGQEAPSTSS